MRLAANNTTVIIELGYDCMNSSLRVDLPVVLHEAQREKQTEGPADGALQNLFLLSDLSRKERCESDL